MAARGNNAKKKDKRRRHAKTRKLARENAPAPSSTPQLRAQQGQTRTR
jgi:hypothetical protein